SKYLNMLDNIIKRVLTEELNHPMVLTESVKISENLKYHLDNQIPLSENVFRIFSQSYFELISEVRKLYNNGLMDINEEDLWLVESNLGESVILDNGKKVWLDVPFEVKESINEAKHRGKNVRLGSPFRTPGGPKKFAVYVKTQGGGVKKVTFGDPNLRVKNANKG
ncbi:MAG: hypothetical protein ACK55I_27705, partial [bacterium]